LDTTKRLLIALETAGLLQLQDRNFPCAVTLVTGESLSRSWWSHPLGHEIFRAVSEIAGHRDILVSKLLDGKVTFVHRRLWPAVLAVAIARDPWQWQGLSDPVRALWEQVESAGNVVASGPNAREVERRLLAHGDQTHTELGKHKTRLETWQAWSLRADSKPSRSPALGRSVLEAAVRDLGGAVTSLPWHQVQPKPMKGR
jgi:hypothetical protein